VALGRSAAKETILFQYNKGILVKWNYERGIDVGLGGVGQIDRYRNAVRSGVGMTAAVMAKQAGSFPRPLRLEQEAITDKGRQNTCTNTSGFWLQASVRDSTKGKGEDDGKRHTSGFWLQANVRRSTKGKGEDD
jgi:hypothetical protein